MHTRGKNCFTNGISCIFVSTLLYVCPYIRSSGTLHFPYYTVRHLLFPIPSFIFFSRWHITKRKWCAFHLHKTYAYTKNINIGFPRIFFTQTYFFFFECLYENECAEIQICFYVSRYLCIFSEVIFGKDRCIHRKFLSHFLSLLEASSWEKNCFKNKMRASSPPDTYVSFVDVCAQSVDSQFLIDFTFVSHWTIGHDHQFDNLLWTGKKQNWKAFLRLDTPINLVW